MILSLKEPFEAQKKFLTANTRYVAYGGARGGGKSFAVRQKATLLCLNYSGIRVLILRRSYPELYENHIKLLISELKSVARYKDADKTLTFKNKSIIKFGYLMGDSDLLQYQGVEYDVIFIDEATHFTEYQFSVISACVRGANSFPKRIYLTCNPGGVGHEWVKRLFIDKRYKKGEDPADYTFISSSIYENKPLLQKDEGYLKTLENLPPDLRRAWLMGDWNVFAGQYFPEWKAEKHTCQPFEIPSWWRKYRAFDYGLDMFAALWGAVDENGHIYVYREYCESGLVVSKAAKKLKELSGDEKYYATLAPPDMRSRQKDSGMSMSELFSREGVPLSYAANSRVDGWMQIKELMSEKEQGDGSVSPSITVFTSCRELIRCIPLLMHDERNPQDVSVYPHDITHITDALRYLVSERLQASHKKVEKSPLAKEKERAIRKSRKRII